MGKGLSLPPSMDGGGRGGEGHHVPKGGECISSSISNNNNGSRNKGTSAWREVRRWGDHGSMCVRTRKDPLRVGRSIGWCDNGSFSFPWLLPSLPYLTPPSPSSFSGQRGARDGRSKIRVRAIYEIKSKPMSFCVYVHMCMCVCMYVCVYVSQKSANCPIEKRDGAHSCRGRRKEGKKRFAGRKREHGVQRHKNLSEPEFARTIYA